MKSFSLFVAD